MAVGTSLPFGGRVCASPLNEEIVFFLQLPLIISVALLDIRHFLHNLEQILLHELVLGPDPEYGLEVIPIGYWVVDLLDNILLFLYQCRQFLTPTDPRLKVRLFYLVFFDER